MNIKIIVAGLVIAGVGLVAWLRHDPPPKHGEFRGELKLELVRPGCMRLLKYFAYVDSSGREWKAPAGYSTDGASIPQAAWSIVGAPFTGEYLKAAVIHDVYCDKRHTSGFTSDQVHEVFHEACVCGGVSASQAKLLFLAVDGFGPQWKLTDTGPIGPPGCAAESVPVPEVRRAPVSVERAERRPLTVLPEARVERASGGVRVPVPTGPAPTAPAPTPVESRDDQIRRVLEAQRAWIEKEDPSMQAVRVRAKDLRTRAIR